MYTYEEVMEYIEQEDVKFIRLAFCDLYGRQKNIAIMPHELKRAFETGISFDASAVPGFGSAVRSDLLLFPDPSTLAVLPWRPASGRVVRMFCDIRHPDGQAFAQDTRRILRQTAAKAAACGVHFRFGAEMEFYLFELDEKGHPTREPFDRAGYMDIAPEDKGENVRREICLYLEEMGILPESSHHEEGPGQNEIDFRYSDVLTAADQAVTFKSVVSTVSMQNGLAADFFPQAAARRKRQRYAYQHVLGLRRRKRTYRSLSGRCAGAHSGDDRFLKPDRKLLPAAWRKESAALYHMVAGKPFAAYSHTCSFRRISPHRAALA